MEEYLIVTENDDGIQSNSQKRKKSLIIHAGFHIDSSTYSQNDREKSGNTMKPFTNCGYVDIQTHGDVKQVDYSRVNNILMFEKEKICGYMDVQRQEEDIPEDYSRVKEVDNMVFLQKQSADMSCTEKGNTDCEPRKPQLCTELIDSGYVETIPAPPLM